MTPTTEQLAEAEKLYADCFAAGFDAGRRGVVKTLAAALAAAFERGREAAVVWADDATPFNGKQVKDLLDENARLRQRLLTAAGDDLCRLSQEEIKTMSLGTVKIPPKEEFLPSCERFHAQMVGEVGVMTNCLTTAQLIAEVAALESALAAEREKSALWERRAREMLAAGETLSEGIDLADKTIADLRKCDQAKSPSGIGHHPDDVVERERVAKEPSA